MASITLLQKAWLFFLYIYFLYFAGFYIPSIFVFCIIFCTHTAQTYLPVFYRLLHMICIINCFFFLYHPTHCLRRLPCLVLHCLCSEKCNSSWSIFSCACVVINKTTVELHAHIMSLSKSGIIRIWHDCQSFSGPEVLWGCTVWGQRCPFHLNIYLIHLGWSHTVSKMLLHNTT